MKISTNWIKDYVDIDEDLRSLANKVTVAGVNIEKVESFEINNLVVGLITEVNNHPDSDHLHLLKVDVGDEVLDIVCGASNVLVNKKVIVAKVGAILPGDFEIKQSTIRGQISNGMVCALFELGIEEKTDENYNKGIAILDDSAPVGGYALEYLGLDDTVYTLDLNPNRNDCLSHLGFAYEVASVTGKKVRMPEVGYTEIDEEMNLDLSVVTDNCYMYDTKVVKDVVIKESPMFIQNRLKSAGMRPINNVVDISNYIMLEYGQPLHFFDYDKLSNNIKVRMAYDNEKTYTLDKKERILNSKDIVITSNDKIVAIAGVMGGLDSSVTGNTRNILIESAIFNPYNIRYTSINLDLRSEASLRLEKVLNYEYTNLALKRACYLLNKYASGQVLKGEVCYSKVNTESKKVSLSLNDINSLLGMNLTDDDVKVSLNNLQFDYVMENDNYVVTIPNRRMDIETNKADMVEEIGRLYGYDKIENILPVSPTKPGSYIGNTLVRKQVSKRLRSLGLNECRTYTLEGTNNLFNYNFGENINLLKPMSEDKKIIRQSILPALLNVYNFNKTRGMKDVMIYEISNVYSNEMDEEVKIAILMKGNYIVNNWQNNKIEADFYTLKGIVSNLLDYLGFKNRYSFIKKEINDMHKGICAEVLLDREPIGFLGKTDPRVSDVFVSELSLSKLMSKNVKPIKHKEVSKYPSITKDLAFVMNKNIASSDVYDILRRVGGRLVTNIDVFDVYEGDNVGTDMKSIAYTITFQDDSKTLTDVEVMDVFNKIISEVTNKLGVELRDK
ncbi:MAG: phenylalanine--tRNA ligase subunit beta [Bacilli bacterium]|nr:phenylalanine--tRNA ligase subunit beta [Bacilli bacterium]